MSYMQLQYPLQVFMSISHYTANISVSCAICMLYIKTYLDNTKAHLWNTV